VGLGVWAATAFISGTLNTSGHGAGGPGTGFAGVGVADGGNLRLPGHLESTGNIFGVWTNHGFASFGTGDLSGNFASDVHLQLNFTAELNGLSLDSATPLTCDGTETIGNNPQAYSCQ
jgi:hypothetical protein